MLGLLFAVAVAGGTSLPPPQRLPVYVVGNICAYALSGRNQTEFWIHFDAMTEIYGLTTEERHEAAYDCQIYRDGIALGVRKASVARQPSNQH